MSGVQVDQAQSLYGIEEKEDGWYVTGYFSYKGSWIDKSPLASVEDTIPVEGPHDSHEEALKAAREAARVFDQRLFPSAKRSRYRAGLTVYESDVHAYRVRWLHALGG